MCEREGKIERERERGEGEREWGRKYKSVQEREGEGRMREGREDVCESKREGG